jgi:hypothetical protein
MKMRDLELTYEGAMHGVQSALRYDMTKKGFDDDEVNLIVNMLKHLRVGLNMRAADAAGLATLLIAKGVITEAEYNEQMRLAANEELARCEDYIRATYGLPEGADFR